MKLQIFAIKKVLKWDSNYTCLKVNRLNSTLKKDDNYVLQVLLNEFKYIDSS